MKVNQYITIQQEGCRRVSGVVSGVTRQGVTIVDKSGLTQTVSFEGVSISDGGKADNALLSVALPSINMYSLAYEELAEPGEGALVTRNVSTADRHCR